MKTTGQEIAEWYSGQTFSDSQEALKALAERIDEALNKEYVEGFNRGTCNPEWEDEE